MFYAEIVRFLADGLMFAIVIIATLALLFDVAKEHRYAAYCRVLLAGLTSLLIAKLISTIFQPADARPFELLGVDPGASFMSNHGFPSDHVLLGAVVTFAVFAEVRHKNIAVLLALLTILMAGGRVLAYVHTVLDVMGGILFASVGALWYLQPKHKRNNTE
jgi:membrane-associated phospholipid phosphatase